MSRGKPKSKRGDDYVANTGLLLLVDLQRCARDLQQLARDVSDSNYKAIYLTKCSVSPKLKDFLCVILKSPGDTLGQLA